MKVIVKKKNPKKPEKWEIDAIQTLRQRIFELEQNLLRAEKEKQAVYSDMERHRDRAVMKEKELQRCLDRQGSVSFKARLIWIRIGKFLRIIDECDNA